MDNNLNTEIFLESDVKWMQHAYDLALRAQQEGEVPVGAVIVKDDQILGQGWNSPIKNHDPTAHAEIMALRNAARNIQNYRLVDTIMYVTLEPCLMCAGAIIHARLQKLVFAASDTRTGAAGSVYSILNASGLNSNLNHTVEVVQGVLAQQSSKLLKQFFKEKRNI